MKAKTKFMEMYNKMPEKARGKLVYDFILNPMTLCVIALEVRHNTILGNKILKILGYEDD